METEIAPQLAQANQSFTLRPYQERSVNAAVAYMKSKRKRNGLLILPTGSGKSIVIANIIKELGEPTLVFQPSKEILMQNHGKLLSYGYHAGIYSASAGIKNVQDITFATVGSVVNKLGMLERFKYVLVDECHAVNSKGGQYEEVISHMGVPVLGLTATPYRLGQEIDERGMTRSILKFLTRTRPRVFEDVVYYVQNKELFDARYLSPIVYHSIKTINRAALQVNSTGADYTDRSVQEAYASSGFYQKLIQVVNRLFHPDVNRKNALVFTRFVREAQMVAQAVPGAVVVSAETPSGERDRIIDGFRGGRIRCVVNCGILCLDDKTEILTREGWVGIDGITYHHNIACWSMDGSIRFSPPKNVIHRQRLDGERMVSAKGSAIDFRVTESHRMVRSAGQDKYWTEAKAIDTVGKRFQFPASGMAKPFATSVENSKLTDKQFARRVVCNSFNYRKSGMPHAEAKALAEDLLLKRYGMTYTQPSDLTLDDCRFIGFWIGDGSLSGGRCVLSQSGRYQNIVDWFDGILSRTGLHHSRSIRPRSGNLSHDVVIWSMARGTGGNGQSKESGYYRLEPYLSKTGTDLFWGLNKDQFMALIEGFWYADGEHGIGNEFWASSRTRWRIRGTQKQMYDLLQAIGACRGVRFTIRPALIRNPSHSPQWTITWNDTTRTSIGWGVPVLENEHKKERVWCVESETSYIITRRNGIVTIMGNCTGFDYPELEAVVMARPTRSLALYYQVGGRGFRIHPEKKNCMFIDLCGNIEQFGHFEDLELSQEGGWHVRSKGRQLTNVHFGDAIRVR